jgi:hypothetical protein
MYKSDEHHGNWVAFSEPNTGSYQWNIDVGNTTNTDFYIEITGYETGKGSTSDFGGYFTVNQKDDAPTLPSDNDESESNNTDSDDDNDQEETNNNQTDDQREDTHNSPTPTPTPTPKPTPKPKTIQTITWSEFFWFEGSSTTNLSEIEDPANVKDFTIDTQYGWTYTFTETIDFTDQKKVETLDNIDQYWTVESWFIWIEIEWWEVYQKPAEIVYKNENLTACPPEIKNETVADSNSNPQQSPSPAPSLEPKIEIKESKPGEVKAAVANTEKIVIEPNVEFMPEQDISTTNQTHQLKAQSSHKNLEYKIKVNGQTKNFDPKDFNNKTGEFTVKLDSLVKGANFIQLLYKNPDQENAEYEIADEIIVNRKLPWKKYLTFSLGGIGGLGLIPLGFWVWKKNSFIK